MCIGMCVHMCRERAQVSLLIVLIPQIQITPRLMLAHDVPRNSLLADLPGVLQ